MHFSASNVNTTNSAYIKVASGNTGNDATKGHIDLVAGHYSGSNMEGDIRFWTGANGNQQRMHIDADGKVGIGNNAPGATLDVTGDANIDSKLWIGNTHTGGTNWASMGGQGNELVIDGGADSGLTILTGSANAGYINHHNYNSANYQHIKFDAENAGIFFKAGGTDDVLALKSNKVGIGTDSPIQPLHIYSNNNNSDVSVIIDNDNAGGTCGLGFASGVGDNVAIGIEKVGSNFAIEQGLGLAGSGTRMLTITPQGGVGIGSNAPLGNLDIKGATDAYTTVNINSSTTQYQSKLTFGGLLNAHAHNLIGEIGGSWNYSENANPVSAIRFETGDDTTNKDDGRITFWTSSASRSLVNRMAIEPDGKIKMGTDITTAPRGFLDVKGDGHNQGFYVNAGSVSLPTDISHSSGAYGFDIQVVNLRMGTSGWGDITIKSKYAGNDMIIGTATHPKALRVVDEHAGWEQTGKEFTDGGSVDADSSKILRYVVSCESTNASATDMFLDGPGGSQRLVIPNNTTWLWECHIVARRTDADDEHAGYTMKGVTYNDGDNANTEGDSVVTTYESNSAWSPQAVDGGSSGARHLNIQGIGEANKTIRWVCSIKIIQVQG